MGAVDANLTQEVDTSTRWIWDCVGICSTNALVDAGVFVAGLALLLLLLRLRRRYGGRDGFGHPGRVLAAGGVGVLASLSLLGFSVQRSCFSEVGGATLGCRTEIMVTVALHGLALLAASLSVLQVGRDLRPHRPGDRAPLHPPDDRR